MKRFLVLLLLLASSSAYCDVSLPSLICDHMVLQRDMNARVWGDASPGEVVTVSIDGNEAISQASSDGKWSVRLAQMKAGGPYDMVIAGKNKIVLHDVLVGDVWVCSGQSNMQVGVNEAKNGEQEIAAANYPNIRLFQTPLIMASTPQSNLQGNWQLCNPDSVRYFSAAGYFFGRELNQDMKVPIGLINSSWGGTPIEGWTSLPALLAMKDLPIAKGAKHNSDEVKASQAAYMKELAAWERRAYAQDTGNKGFGRGWAAPSTDTSDWGTMYLPQAWEQLGSKMDIDGAVWFRLEVDVPAEWAGKDLVAKLGTIDDFDVTYFNNTEIGSTDESVPNYWAAKRVYKVPGGLVKAGRNVIAVRVFDHFGTGGLTGGRELMMLQPASDGEKTIPLAGEWKYKVEQGAPPIAIPCASPVVPFVAGEGGDYGHIFNQMINPLTSYGIKGVIWYQGETNAPNSCIYKDLLTGMIADWRSRWGEGDFPFLVVQLANFGYVDTLPLESNWAEVRDAQRRTALSVPNVGLAVAIDIGEEMNIHPKNKQEVGRRLALAAEKIAYGKKVSYSGPIYKSMKVDGNKVRLNFTEIHGGLVAAGNKDLTGFAVATSDKRFVWAKAKIDGNSVVVWSDEIAKPTTVRYAWGNNPVCNLYNKAGLPASPFTTD